MARAVDRKKWNAWRRRLARFVGSGRTVVGFCEAEGVSVGSFYQWRKKIAEAGGTDAVAVPSEEGAFAAVRVLGAATLVAELPGGTRVHLPTGDMTLLRAMLDELVAAGARVERGGGSC